MGQVLLFDLDGTLVDTLGDFVLALQAMCDEILPSAQRWAVQAQEVELLVGRGAEHLVQQLLQRHLAAFGTEAEPALVRRAVECYLHHYGRINGHSARVYPGVREALTQWQTQGRRMACVTNKPQAHAQALLGQCELLPFFAVVVGAQEGLRKKPHPDALLRACAMLGVEASQALMVGDSANDVQAARAAGCAVALVSYGYNHGQSVRQAGADWVVDRMELLQELTAAVPHQRAT